MSAKYIFVTGGVVSSLGKGLTAASISCLLESRGLKVTLTKFDTYLNVDPGTMSPSDHGEAFVTDYGPRTQYQAHAALGQATAQHRNSARYAALPHRPLPLKRDQVQDCTFL